MHGQVGAVARRRAPHPHRVPYATAAVRAMTSTRRNAAPLPLTGDVTVPGDKSISHRALIVAALASGRSVVTGINDGDDVRATAAALTALGVTCAQHDPEARVEVEGRGWDGLREPEDVVDCGNSGTTLRILLGVCAGVEGLTILTGDGSLRRRPMLRIVAPLRQMGAAVDGRRFGEQPPLAVRGGSLQGIDFESPIPSAQVKTALLLAGLRATGATSVTEPQPSRDHTERMLAAAGVPLRRSDGDVALDGGAEISPGERWVPGDLSSALYLVAAALLVPGSDLRIREVGLNPTRTGALDVLAAMGADLEIRHTGDSAGEPYGDIHVRHCDLTGIEVDPLSAARYIDEVPILAIVAARAAGTTAIRGVRELRVKESDRIEATVTGLRALGVEATALPDGLEVTGAERLGGGEVDSAGDHRIALSFAIAGLIADDNVRVGGWSCVDTSFPTFLDVLSRAQGRGS